MCTRPETSLSIPRAQIQLFNDKLDCLKDCEEARTGIELGCEFLFPSCLNSIHILTPTQQSRYTLTWELSNFNINLAYFTSKL